jgi:hypothetical protein
MRTGPPAGTSKHAAPRLEAPEPEPEEDKLEDEKSDEGKPDQPVIDEPEPEQPQQSARGCRLNVECRMSNCAFRFRDGQALLAVIALFGEHFL